MFVVRLTGPARSDWKAFTARSDAMQRFLAARKAIFDDDLEDVRAIIFQVPGETDARRAVERVQAGDANILDKSWMTVSPADDLEAQRIIDEMIRR